MNKNIKTAIALALTGAAMVSASGCRDGGGVTTPTKTTTNTSNQEFESETFMNPVLPVTEGGQVFKGQMADPHIVRDGNKFYIFATSRVWAYSDDAVYWTLASKPVFDRPTWGDDLVEKGFPEVWAPDVKKIGDKWIYYYSLSVWGEDVGIGYAVADSLAGPWEDKGKLFTGAEVGVENCIDPAPFIDDDGSVYIAVGSFYGIWLIELNSDGQGLLLDAEYAKENKVCLAGYASSKWDGSQYEGAYIMKKGEYYYFFGSTGSCCNGKDSTYQVRCGKSKSVAGPYVDANGVPLTLSRDGRKIGEVVVYDNIGDGETAGPGHNSILVDDNGEWWIYYHAYLKDMNYDTRHLMIDHLVWDENGFPSVEGKKPSVHEEKDGPALFK